MNVSEMASILGEDVSEKYKLVIDGDTMIWHSKDESIDVVYVVELFNNGRYHDYYIPESGLTGDDFKEASVETEYDTLASIREKVSSIMRGTGWNRYKKTVCTCERYDLRIISFVIGVKTGYDAVRAIWQDGVDMFSSIFLLISIITLLLGLGIVKISKLAHIRFLFSLFESVTICCVVCCAIIILINILYIHEPVSKYIIWCVSSAVLSVLFYVAYKKNTKAL